MESEFNNELIEREYASEHDFDFEWLVPFWREAHYVDNFNQWECVMDMITGCKYAVMQSSPQGKQDLMIDLHLLWRIANVRYLALY